MLAGTVASPTHLLVDVADVHSALHIIFQAPLHLLAALLLARALLALLRWALAVVLQGTPSARAPATAAISWAHAPTLMVVAWAPSWVPVGPVAIQHLVRMASHALRRHVLLVHGRLLLPAQARCWRSIAVAVCAWRRPPLLRSAIVLSLARGAHHLLLWVEHEVALDALGQVCHALLLTSLPSICWGQPSSVVCRNGSSRQPVRHIGHRYCRGHPAHAVGWSIVIRDKWTTHVALLLLIAAAALLELSHARAAALYY